MNAQKKKFCDNVSKINIQKDICHELFITKKQKNLYSKSSKNYAHYQNVYSQLKSEGYKRLKNNRKILMNKYKKVEKSTAYIITTVRKKEMHVYLQNTAKCQQ